jgi:hypothetical protein
MVREDAEELRRRLYAPGASGDDLDRYRRSETKPARAAAAAPALPAPPTSADPVDSAPPVRTRRGPLRAVVVAAVVVLVIAGGITAARLAADGRPSGPPPTPIAMSAEDRRSVQENLALGNYAGIAAFLVTHRAIRSLQTAKRIDTVERMGTGDDTVLLSDVPAVAARGRATVLLVLGGSGQAGWTTLRRRVDPSGEQQYVRQVERSGFQEGGVITTHTFRYGSGNRPVELHVSAPAGVHWGAAVVFSD